MIMVPQSMIEEAQNMIGVFQSMIVAPQNMNVVPPQRVIAMLQNMIVAPSSKIYQVTQPRPIEERAFFLWLHPAALATLCHTLHSAAKGQRKTLWEGALGLTTEVRGVI